MDHAHAEFDPNCEGCRPALMDPRTGQRISNDDPAMKLVNEIWDASPREEQEACFRIWVHNSRDEKDMRLAQGFFERVQARMGGD